jgi:uncharacterized lipoprotein YajG
MKIKLLIALSLGMLFTGCSFKNQKVVVDYTSNNVTGNEKGVVCLNKFADERADKSRIGSIKNSSAEETGSVVTDQDVAALISKALEKELKNLGYTVKLVDVQYEKGVGYDNDCTFIDGKVQNFFVKHDFGIAIVESKSVVSVNITVQNRSGKEFRKKYTTDSNSETFAGTYGRVFKETADDALNTIVSNIKADLPSVIEK